MASIHMIRRGFLLLDGTNTSVALEPCFWEALEEICRCENKSLRKMVRQIEAMKPNEYPLTGAIRVFILKYHVSAAAMHLRSPIATHNLAEEIEQSQTSSVGDLPSGLED